MSLAQKMHFFTGRVSNDRLHACLSKKSFSNYWVKPILRYRIHTHTHTYIYIYIYRERERERKGDNKIERERERGGREMTKERE